MQQSARDYELVVIAAPQLDDQGLATFNERIAGWITSGAGTVTGTNVWGRRPLTYPIRKQQEGIYVQFNFQLAPGASRELERNLRLDEQVIRYLLMRSDEI
jgi:small subunit ribosomal protein S6